MVERGRGVRDAVEVERGDDLVDVHHLAAVVGRPAEQREVVDERLGQVAGVAELLDATAPCRFESLARSGPRISGRCA